MVRWLVLVAVALAVAGGLPAPLAAQQGASRDHHFEVTWEAVPRRGGTVLQGYIVNRAAQQAGEFRIAVEVLDTAGRTVSTTTRILRGDVVTGDRLFFEVPVANPAANYRVRVVDFSWIRGGGGA